MTFHSLQTHSRPVGATLEALEQTMLSTFAAKSSASKGRAKKEAPCPIRTDFQRDRDRILHSKAFRRLKHKTQVFIAPVGDHYRTRLTHTLEVAQIARTIARALRLNEDLTEAIALGHDVGHPPFGHAGEEALNHLLQAHEPQEHFQHTAHTLRIFTVLEPKNLCAETLNALAAQGDPQTGAPEHETLEGQLVELADRIAYLHHDVEDATRAGLMQEAQLPEHVLETLGNTRSKRLETMMMDVIATSQSRFDLGQPTIVMSDEVYQATMTFRDWMHRCVYHSTPKQTQDHRVTQVMTGLFEFFMAEPNQMTISDHLQTAQTLAEPVALARQVTDYIAGMTDRFAIAFYIDQLLPQGRSVF
ncbi:MAG: deoxyguanosinetriphosphate triphosphohydrolase [Vampirovibrionales bacterium]|nr:deoxyguanosinetriphosphate triphosphohydrolase [Vampirovibrionales bacterium]